MDALATIHGDVDTAGYGLFDYLTLGSLLRIENPMTLRHIPIMRGENA